MEGLNNPEAAQEALRAELTSLAEQHGLTMAELASTARELADYEESAQRAAKQEAIDSNPHMREFSRLVGYVGWQYEQHAIHGQFSDLADLEEFGRNLPQVLESLGFVPGATVTVQRTDGTIEDDWTFQSFDPESGRVLVTKESGNEEAPLRKNIRLLELLKQNPPN